MLPTMQVSASSENNPPLQNSVQNISVMGKHEGKLVPVDTMNRYGEIDVQSPTFNYFIEKLLRVLTCTG
jgi:hypothetical protein